MAGQATCHFAFEMIFRLANFCPSFGQRSVRRAGPTLWSDCQRQTRGPSADVEAFFQKDRDEILSRPMISTYNC